jgi:hypothetical protein
VTRPSLTPVVCAALALACAGGCGGGAAGPTVAATLTAQEEAQAAACRDAVSAWVDAVDEMTEILARVEDQFSMARALARLEERSGHFEAVAVRLQSFRSLSKAVRDRAEEGLQPRIEEAIRRKQAEVRRLQNLPIGQEFLAAVAKLKNAKGSLNPGSLR